MKRLAPIVAALILLAGCNDKTTDLPDGLYAKIDTDKGTIVTTLEFEKAPVTVANFITLAEGDNPFVAKPLRGRHFYDGLTFHRVEQNFMIQGGDPSGDGSGGPGYRFRDEFSDLDFSRPGVLAMANAGPDTNGSQFFITHVPTPFLNHLHTVFGFVVGDGMSVVNAIARGDVINSVTIVRKGDKAKKFDAVKVFTDYVKNQSAGQRRRELQAAADKKAFEAHAKAICSDNASRLGEMFRRATKTKSGLRYTVLSKGSGKKPKSGTTVFIDYAGFLENGMLFDTNIAAVARKNGSYNAQWDIAGKYRPISFQIGKKQGMIPGFIEALELMSPGEKIMAFVPAHLGYGPQGAGRVIPPDANLFFELELVAKPN
jgi:peptidylprolyl isomerase